MNTPTKPPVEPGIDLRKLKPGMVVLLEADPGLYEMRVTHPAHGVAEISSNDPALRTPTVGQVLHSLHWSSPGVPIPLWIAKGLALEIRFRNGLYRTQPVTAARVSGTRDDGSRWSYEVF